jgi:hypothetical protein
VKVRNFFLFVCVLNFERQAHFYTQWVNEVFANKGSQYRVYNEATPANWLECIQQGADEVVVIAHSLAIKDGGKVISLGYYRQLEPPQRSELLSKAHQYFSTELERMDQEIRDLEISGRNSFERHQNRYQDYINSLKIQRRDLEARFHRVEAFPEDKPLYEISTILPKIFQRMKESSKAGNFKWKKLRIAACNPDKVFEPYPELRELIQTYRIDVEYGVRPLLNYFSSEETAIVTKGWLEKSLHR